MSPLTASLQVLEEHPRIRLAPSNIMDSSLVKEYIVDVWEIQKHKLYDSDSGPGQQLHSRSSPGKSNGKFSQNGKFKLGHSCTNVTKGKLYGSWDSDHAIVHLGLNVSSSARNCWYMVDGGNAMAAI